jgi:hypothetical protein
MKAKKKRWQFFLIVLLVFLSTLFYFLHFIIFHDSHHIFIYLIGDIAFVPIEVLLVTLIIHRLLEAHQKKAMMKKLNMVIGSFFSEVGTVLLKELSKFCKNISDVSPMLNISPQWSNKKFLSVRDAVQKYSYQMDAFQKSPAELKEFLISKQHFFLDLLGNPNLLEHDQFTDLMWAVLHLTEELQFRESLEGLPQTDMDHISNDMKRAYSRLLLQWLDYMEHLKDDYPYLYSLSVRTNPFNPGASIIISK